MKLSILSILLGAGMSVPQIYGLARPKEFAAAARKLPRNYAAGVILMLLGTAWFVWNVNIEPISDFEAIKPYMMAGFAAVGILCCFFVQDFRPGDLFGEYGFFEKIHGAFERPFYEYIFFL